MTYVVGTLIGLVLWAAVSVPVSVLVGRHLGRDKFFDTVTEWRDDVDAAEAEPITRTAVS